MGSEIILGFLVLAGGAGIIAAQMLGGRRHRSDNSPFRVGLYKSAAKERDDGTGFGARLKGREQFLSKKKKLEKLTFEELLFRAAVFSPEDRIKYERIRMWGPLGGAIFGLFIVYSLVGFSGSLAILLPVVFTAAGLRANVVMLESRQKSIEQEVQFYLPIVIEQMVIGVSSSLDIGPCVQKIVDMAFERDRSNPVVDLLDRVLVRVRAGHSLDESLTEIAERMKIVDLKHVFGAIAQVSRHGGEVTRQLQELADAVTTQREVQVEGTIKKLELKATGPVAIAFLSFLATLFTGIGCMLSNQMTSAL